MIKPSNEQVVKLTIRDDADECNKKETMKKVMVSLLTMSVLSVAVAQNNSNATRATSGEQPIAQAGEGRMKHKTPDEWVSELDAVVTLTGDQKAQAKTLAVQTDEKMKALRAEAQTNNETIKQKRMQLRQEQKAALDKILDDAQKAKLKAHHQEMRTKQGPPHKHRTPDEQVNEIDGIVALTAEQKVKVKALAEAKEIKMKALRDEQKNAPDENVFKEKRQQIGKEFRMELDKVLTAEQAAKLKAHRDAMKQQKGAPKR